VAVGIVVTTHDKRCNGCKVVGVGYRVSHSEVLYSVEVAIATLTYA